MCVFSIFFISNPWHEMLSKQHSVTWNNHHSLCSDTHQRVSVASRGQCVYVCVCPSVPCWRGGLLVQTQTLKHHISIQIQQKHSKTQSNQWRYRAKVIIQSWYNRLWSTDWFRIIAGHVEETSTYCDWREKEGEGKDRGGPLGTGFLTVRTLTTIPENKR